MADTARDNLDEDLARPRRLDGDLSHVKAVAVVVRHTCKHAGRKMMGGGSGWRHCGADNTARGAGYDETDAAILYDKEVLGLSKMSGLFF